jgi:hypothetical protein
MTLGHGHDVIWALIREAGMHHANVHRLAIKSVPRFHHHVNKDDSMNSPGHCL